MFNKNLLVKARSKTNKTMNASLQTIKNSLNILRLQRKKMEEVADLEKCLGKYADRKRTIKKLNENYKEETHLLHLLQIIKEEEEQEND